jgi:glutaredoxin
MQFQKVSGKKNDHKVTVYALSTCVWCKLTKQYLSDNSITYEIHRRRLLDDKDKGEAHEAITSKGGVLSYPTYYIIRQNRHHGFRERPLR